MSDALNTILWVDDEINLLAPFIRALEDHYAVTAVPSGTAALALIHARGPFDIVIADMCVPGMEGEAFLKHVRENWPESVRLLLIGYAARDLATAAVNDGAIFGYVTKPCSPKELLSTMRLAAERHREAVTEQYLLQTTLAATVKTLSDILALSSPWAFSRASLARSCVCHALTKLKWPQGWIYEVAAALSQIGSVGMPEETLRRDIAQRPLNASDARMMDEHPEAAYRLLKEIPRLEMVADIIRYQAKGTPADAPIEVTRGAQLLRAAVTVGPYLMRGNPIKRGLDALRNAPHPVSAAILGALSDFRIEPGAIRAANIAELVPGWVLGENVSTTKGQLLLSKGHELTEAAIYTLRRLKYARLILEPIYVQTNAIHVEAFSPAQREAAV